MESSPSPKPYISIIVCTYNNADSLKITINQLLNQQLAKPELFELIVVDNNSSDHTNSIINSFSSGKIEYRPLFESRQGLSHARNTGIEAAGGEYILFTDDDAEISPSWLDSYLNKIQLTKAECIFGKISVIWDQPKPWWYDERYRGFFAVIDYGDNEFKVESKNTPFFGKNFCIKKQFLIEMGGFDPELGRKGDDLLGGEEILVFNRLVEEKRIVHYFPDITVGHRLKPREYTAENIRKQYIACAKPIVQIAKTQPGKRIGTRPLGVLELQLKDAFDSIFSFIKSRLKGDRKDSFFQAMRFSRSIKVITLWLKN